MTQLWTPPEPVLEIPTEARAIPPELLAHATDQELQQYLIALRIATKDLRTWELQPRQRRAEQALTDIHAAGNADLIELLYGGAAGGGKSEWMLWHLYHLALKYPGFSGIFFRKTFPELRRYVIMRALARFDPNKARYYKTDHVWEFENGSHIEFAYLERDDQVYKYQSAEFDAIAWDELTQWSSPDAYVYLLSRLRVHVEKEAMGLYPHAIAGTNPGQVGGAWVKARWIDLGPAETPVDVEIEIPDDPEPRYTTRVFIPAKLTDNRYINTRVYRAALANLAEPIRRALEEGSWDTVEGQYFTEFDRKIHVIPPFEIPEWWERFRSHDFGIAKPAAWLWFALDGDGNLYVYRELYGTRMTPKQQAALVIQANGLERARYTVCDPSIWTNTGAGPPIAQQYADAGITGLVKANNARVDGWARLRDYLRVDEMTEKPKLFIFDHCVNLLRTLPMLVHDKKNPEDLDTDGEDHAADALRYGVMSRPAPSKQPRREPVTLEERHEQARKDRKAGKGRMENTPVGTVWK